MTALVRLLSYFSFLEAAVSESKNERPSLATIIYHILTKTAGENSPFPEREIQKYIYGLYSKQIVGVTLPNNSIDRSGSSSNRKKL